MQNNLDALDIYERRLLKAASNLPVRRPWVAAERADIIAVAANCLGIREAWIPHIQAELVGETAGAGINVQYLRFVSWPRCFGAAHLYLPRVKTGSPLPLVILCCGHGAGCKRAPGYQAMAWRLAQMGSAVLVADNIGQGERVAMGHADAVGPFQVGLSVQGLIVMESMAWLRWIRQDGRFDVKRIAAIGNSGGGNLTLFLGAFCRNELAVLSSSGHPSTFEFIARKEKKLCNCTILPGIVGQLEMWQLYSCFAPKPLFLFQGSGDALFPADLFYATCRKVKNAYRHAQATDKLTAEIFSGGHSWDRERHAALGEFLRRNMGLSNSKIVSFKAKGLQPPGNCFRQWPKEALSTDQLALQITGKRIQTRRHLWEVFIPVPAPHSKTEFPLRRVAPRQVCAQFESFLTRRVKAYRAQAKQDFQSRKKQEKT